MNKKILSILLAIIMVMSTFTVLSLTVHAQEAEVSETGADNDYAPSGVETELSDTAVPSESQFAASIASLQHTYVHGQYWNKASSPDYSRTGNIPCSGISYSSAHYGQSCTSVGYCDYCSDECGYFAGAYQCWGFAYKMAYLSLGSYPGQSGWSQSFSLGTVYAGDVIRIRNDTHSIFVYKVVGDTIYFADCNWTGPCQVRWGGTYTYSQLQSVFTYKWHLSGNTLTGNPVTKPSNAWIAVNKTSLYVGDSVTFTFGANDAEGYNIGINRNGTRIITEGVTSGKTYTFNETGSYTAYVSAYNSAGYVDSNVVSFTVKEQTPIQESWVRVSGWTIIDDEHHQPVLTVWKPSPASPFIRQKLVENTDYTVSTERYREFALLDSSSDPTDYNFRATITGIGDYCGTVTIYERKPLEYDMITVTGQIETENYYEPEFIIQDGEYILEKDVDYTEKVIIKRMNISGGEPLITYYKKITGIGNYFGALRYECQKKTPMSGDVSGTITSFLDDSAEITVNLYKRNTNFGSTPFALEYPVNPTYTVTVTGNKANYLFEDLKVATYKLEIKKQNHVKSVTTFKIDGNVIQDIELIPNGLALGDTDVDGVVSILDVTAIQRRLASVRTEVFCEKASDADGDGELSVIDVTYIQRHCALMETPYPIGEPIENV